MAQRPGKAIREEEMADMAEVAQAADITAVESADRQKCILQPVQSVIVPAKYHSDRADQSPSSVATASEALTAGAHEGLHAKDQTIPLGSSNS